MKRFVAWTVRMALWVVFSGYFDAFFVIAGAASAAASVWVSGKFRDVTSDDEYRSFPATSLSIMKLAKNYLGYVLWLIWQTVLSTLYMTKKIFRVNTSGIIRPVAAVIGVKQNSGLGMFMLTNSITVTPGTVGMCTTYDGKVHVLAFDEELLRGITEMDDKVCRVFS